MSPVDLKDEEAPASTISPIYDYKQIDLHGVPNTKDESKPQDPLLTPSMPQSPLADHKTLSSASSSPLKKTFTGNSGDVEKIVPEQQSDGPQKKKSLEQKKRILDIAQRTASLLLSIIILAVMTHAYLVFLANKDVTHDGTRIYPTFMQLWPTYMMIAAGAITVALNLATLIWRVHGTTRDFSLITASEKYWDYALHGINFAIWAASTTSFKVTKNWGTVTNPNVLWGYTCSPTATQLSQSYPDIVRFYVQCEIQTVSFWMSVSAIIVEGFALLTKLFVR